MPPPDRLDARQLLAVLRVAERWLELNREPVNAINVYPVPDGDTGTNMLLTWRAALEAAESAADADAVGPLMASMAQGALLGARGNSGVILSQMIRGLADTLADADELDGPALCAALGSAARVAYDALSQPVEGTMLTVMREAAQAAEAAADGGAPPTIEAVLDAAAEEAQASTDRTPTLLPRLAEAGVVDAGGLGVAVLLAGIRFGYRGEELPPPMATPAGAVALGAVEHHGHGYCTEYVVVGRGLDRHALAASLEAAGGESVLVVGDAEALHVHVHTEDPGPALSAGIGAGALESVKVDNMQRQHEQWAAGHEAGGAAAAAEPPAIGVVAVAQGDGIAAAFRDLGATRVVDGGPTANPSAGELLEAARGAGRDHVFILANDPNVVMAAEQAAAEEPALITVIPSHSVAAGFAALIAYIPEGDPPDIARRMREAFAHCHSVEVTRAVRDTVADGVEVAAGAAIAMLDGRLVGSAETLEEALLEGLARVAEGAEIATLYLGADAPPGAAERVRALIEEAHAGLEVEVLEGGQPHYPYILGVE